MTQEQQDPLDGALRRRAEAQDEVNLFAEKYRRTRWEALKAQYLDSWHWEQRMFDTINDIVPGRYKAKLRNRSCREGASRAGTALEKLRVMRALRKEYVE